MFSLIIKLVKELLFFVVMAAGIWLYSDDPAPAGELKIPARPASSAGIYVKDEAEVGRRWRIIPCKFCGLGASAAKKRITACCF